MLYPMTTYRTVAPLLLLLLAVVLVALALTGAHLYIFSGECASAGGTFSVEGTSAWCRY